MNNPMTPSEPREDAVAVLPPIDRDEEFDRDYIPLPGGWEIQTRGKGSTFRICDPRGNRLPIPDSPYLHETLTRMAREVHAAAALAQQGAEHLAWIPVSERLPASCQPVLVCVEVEPSGKRHVIRAMYTAANTLELGDEQEWWEGCTTDENETVYVPAGWYEQNQYDETSWHVSDAVIAWQPLPAAPTGAPR